MPLKKSLFRLSPDSAETALIKTDDPRPPNPKLRNVEMQRFFSAVAPAVRSGRVAGSAALAGDLMFASWSQNPAGLVRPHEGARFSSPSENADGREVRQLAAKALRGAPDRSERGRRSTGRKGRRSVFEKRAIRRFRSKDRRRRRIGRVAAPDLRSKALRPRPAERRVRRRPRTLETFRELEDIHEMTGMILDMSRFTARRETFHSIFAAADFIYT